MKFKNQLLIVFVLVLFAGCNNATEKTSVTINAADAIYYGGDILTMEGDSAQYAESIVVKDGKIAFVGSKDEAFVASKFKPAVQKNSKGKVIVIEGATHDGIRHNKRAMEEVKTWFQKYYN